MMQAEEVERIIRFYIEASECPDMRIYGRSFLDHYDRALHSVRHMMQLGNMRGACVLDLGCGFGWHALLLSLLGDNQVLANDVRKLMIHNIDERISAVRDKFGIRPILDTLLGDFTELDIVDESVDAIFCNQTIEHVRNLDACFRKAYVVLKPGGSFVIADDNNCLVRSHLRRIEQMWRKRDTSWEFIEELKRERPEENHGIKPYTVMREEIIRSVFPKLSDDAVVKLAYATAGQVEGEIVCSTGRFLADGTLPERPRYSWCRNPITGEYCERQFDPFALKAHLQRTGFRVRLLQDIRRGGPLKVSTRTDVPLLNRILFWRRARFVLAARKSPP